MPAAARQRLRQACGVCCGHVVLWLASAAHALTEVDMNADF